MTSFINTQAYVMFSVLKLETIELMKFSLITTVRIAFQSLAFSPSRRHIDSRANLTTAGGLAIDRTSTNCCFFISFTAINNVQYITLHTVLQCLHSEQKIN